MTGPASAAPVRAEDIFDALEATWPPTAWHLSGGWRIGEGRGGGKRVSAALPLHARADIGAMERTQAALGQPFLAMIRPGMKTLDAALEARDYRMVDPTVGLTAPVSAFAEAMPRLTAHEVAWPPLGFQREIWAQGGIGPARLAVMERAKGARISLLGRADNRPSATAFAACHGTMAMVHALEVLPDRRRAGLGRALMLAAARWARRAGAERMGVLVTRANGPARALYQSLGMEESTGYHYRVRQNGA